MKKRAAMTGLMAACCCCVAAFAADSLAPVYRAGHGALKADLCIGDDASDEYLMAKPTVVVDDDGNVFVLDNKLHNIRKFDANGKWMKTFSGKGEGPGEMGSWAAIGVLRNGGVVMADFWNARLTEFTSEGDYLRDAKLAPMTVIYRLEPSTDGGMFVEQHDVDPETGWTVTRIDRYNVALERVATIDTLAYQEHVISSLGGEWLEYREGIEWATTPNGALVIAHNKEYKLRVYSPTHELIRTIERTVDPVPVTKRDRGRFVGASTNDNQRKMREAMELPEYKPCIRGLRCDSAGYLLVCLPDEMDTDTHYDVFDPAGEFVGRATLPPLKQLAVLKNGFVYWVDTPEDAAPQVCRGRLVAATKN